MPRPPCLAAAIAGALVVPGSARAGPLDPASDAVRGSGAIARPLPPRFGLDLRAFAIAAPDLHPVVLERALFAAATARRAGYGRRRPYLTIIDYGRPVSERRLWVLDVKTKQLVFHEHVAHGRGTGGEIAERWSNEEGTLASSIGLFVTRETYIGRRGYSLRLIGLEPRFNDRAFARRIVIHGARYMSEAHRARTGSFGQSHGCPALDPKVSRLVIDTLRGGSLVFIHFPDPEWLASSFWLKGRPPPDLRARPATARRPSRARRPTKPAELVGHRKARSHERSLPSPAAPSPRRRSSPG